MTPAGSVHLAAYRAHSLAEYRADPLAEYRVEYEAVLTQARRTVADYPPLLRDLAQPLLPGWGESSFSRIVALLPYWVADLLDQAAPPEDRPRPSRPEETEALALANLLGWWSHLIQDGLLDREPEHAELLPLSAALHASAVHLLAY
nr:hypothetical protein [Anaerolineae bacterium]